MGNLIQFFSAVAPVGSQFWILCELDIEQRQRDLRLCGWEHNHRVNVVHSVGLCRRKVLAQDIITRRKIDRKEVTTRATSSSIVPEDLDDGPSSGRRNMFKSVKISKASSSHSGHSRNRSMNNSPALDAFQSTDGEYASAAASSSAAAAVASALRGTVGQDKNNVSSKSGLVESGIARSRSANGDDMARKRSTPNIGLARARSQKFLGAKNVTECSAPRGVIVGEIVDSRSRAMLSMVNSIDAVVASSELISKAVAMVSEDSSVNRVLNTLFDPYDSEITLEGVERYINVGANERVSFFELMARGRRLGTIVLGYLEREIVPHSEADSSNSTTIRYVDVALNPENKDVRRGWHVDDLLIVLTPGASEAGSAAEEPSEFLTDIEQVKTLDITREFSWDYDANDNTAAKARVRFSNHE